MAPIRLKGAGENRIAYLGLTLAFLFLAWYTWGHWGNLRIDIGRELYVPSSLLHGKLLYRDLWYPYGPLTPYLQALLYRLFGLHWNVLYLFGLAITLSCALLLFVISRRFVSATAAFLVSFCFLMQGFRPHLFNYIVPYGHAATIGSLLGLACLYFIVRTTLNEPGPNLWLAGSVAGLALLCKQEFGLASYLLIAFVLIGRVLMQRSGRILLSDLLACVPGLLINVFVYGWFIWRLSPRLVLLENIHTPGSYFVHAIGEQWLAVWGLRFISSEMVKTAAIGILALTVWFLLALVLRYALRHRFVMWFAAAGFGLL
ncbi:MAG: glycosyltransferase family 39 protein, partial [bacterium]